MPEKKSEDTYSYKGWMVSDKFIKRAFGVFGHYFVANLIISAIVMTLIFFFVMLVGGAAIFSGIKDGKWEKTDKGWTMQEDWSYHFDTYDDEDDQVFCTQDAKLCPDGSYVARSGPNCEFDPCPGEEGAMPGGRVMQWEEGVFGQSHTLAVGQTIIYEGGLEMTLQSIDDSRCPEDVVCVWQGELSPTFSVTGGPLAEDRTILRLGTETAPEADVNGYIVELLGATEVDAEIRVRG